MPLPVPVEQTATKSIPGWFISPSDLTVEAAVPLVVAWVLIVASLSVAVRDWRRTGAERDLHELGTVSALVLGSVAIAVSVTMALHRPDSLSAFFLGSVGGTGCYLGVFRRLFVDEGGTFLHQLVAVASLVWTAGALTVGAVAGAGAGHYAVAAAFGTVLAITTVAFTIRQRTGSESPGTSTVLLGGLLLAGAFLVPATVGTLFGEEILFVTYSIAFVLTAILWWFLRLSSG